MNDDRRPDSDKPVDGDRDPSSEDQGVLEFLNDGEDPENLDLLDDADLAELDLDGGTPLDAQTSSPEELTPPPAPPAEGRPIRRGRDGGAPETTATPKAAPKTTATLREPNGGRRFPPIMIVAAVVIVVGAVILLNPFRGKEPLRQEGPKNTILTAQPEETGATTDSVPQSSFEEMDEIEQRIVPEAAGAAVGRPQAAPPLEETIADARTERPAEGGGGQNVVDPEAVPPGPADPAKPGPDGGLCIQVGLGRDAEGANRQAAELTERGHRALVVPVGTQYRIVVGYFDTNTAATAYLDRYKSELPQGSWVRSR